MTRRHIDDLVESLCQIPAGVFTRRKVLQEVGRTVLDPGSMTRYLYFDSAHYTRNLIYACEIFEVIAIGWEVGQGSSIHNHRGQECWMGVTHGRIEVRNFKLLEKCPRSWTCKLEPSSRFIMDPAHPAVVNPEQPIHSVHNLPEWGERAVSVHVYSKPFDCCEVYDLDRGTYQEVKLSFTSRQGVLCGGESGRLSGAR